MKTGEHTTKIFSGGVDFRSTVGAHAQPFYLQLTKWSCQDECRYDCMWKTVEAMTNRNWDIPQFHGKVFTWHYTVNSLDSGFISLCFFNFKSSGSIIRISVSYNIHTQTLYHICMCIRKKQLANLNLSEITIPYYYSSTIISISYGSVNEKSPISIFPQSFQFVSLFLSS
jgi:hypothetical protein